MTITPIAIAAAEGARGFDTNARLRSVDATRFVEAGYLFALRYIPRERPRANDLTLEELQLLFAAGLAVMPVQHVEPGFWTPDDDKGRRYGQTAASVTHSLGFPAGTTVWLDLEEVDGSVPSEQIIRYCNYWHDAVATAGFQPGIYVGDSTRLSPEQLYRRLKFTRYWAAYNLNLDEYPSCGVCMHQLPTLPPAGVGVPIDGNVVSSDAFGRVPTLAAPAERFRA